MPPRSASLPLDASSLGRLAGLVGRRWRLVTGYPLSEAPGQWFSWDDAVVAVDGAAVRVHVERVGLDFEGYEEECPFLSVTADDDGLAAALASGLVCDRYRGQQVTGVLVVRETITQLLHGEPRWRYSTDYGIVLELSGGAVAVSKGSHRAEGLLATTADRVEDLVIPDRSIEWDWDNDPGEEYLVERQRIPLAELLPPVRGAGGPGA